MIASIDLVLRFISWELNCGDKINFWRDSWNGQPLLITLPNVHKMMASLESAWGNLVIHFIDAIYLHSRIVICKDLDQLFLDNQNKHLFCKILAGRTTFIPKFKDRLIWLLDAKGKYSIKEGYKLLQNIASEKNPLREYMLCWNNVVLPKAGCFSWLAIKNRILTSDHLERLKVAPPFKCVLYQDEYESMDHLFASC